MMCFFINATALLKLNCSLWMYFNVFKSVQLKQQSQNRQITNIHSSLVSHTLPLWKEDIFFIKFLIQFVHLFTFKRCEFLVIKDSTNWFALSIIFIDVVT